MLKITNEGRKMALDQRIINPLLPDDPGSKVNACIQQIYETWEATKEEGLTQVFFCDISVPHGDGSFNVYDDIREKLIERGVPLGEIAVIHNAKTEKQKQAMFAAVRSGKIRIIMGSTQRMGTGTNMQDYLITSHDLDPPWRPTDLEQRAGRIIRPGNRNPAVVINRYVTVDTFDAYMYQTIEIKQRQISQIFTSKTPARVLEDTDTTVLSYAAIKAAATGDPRIKEKMELEVDVEQLRMQKSSYFSQRFALEEQLQYYTEHIPMLKDRIKLQQADMRHLKENTTFGNDGKPKFSIKVNGLVYEKKEAAGVAIIELCKSCQTLNQSTLIGDYRGFDMYLSVTDFGHKISLKHQCKYAVNLGESAIGNIQRLNHALDGIADEIKKMQNQLAEDERQAENARQELEKPFLRAEELNGKEQRLAQLNFELMDNESNIIVMDEDETEIASDDAVEKPCIPESCCER